MNMIELFLTLKSWKFFKSLIVGGISAIVSLLVLWVLTEHFYIFYIKSSLVGFSCAFFVNFLLQKYWTFNERSGNILNQFVKTFILALLNILLNTIMLYILTDVFGLWYIFSQILTMGSLAVLNFTALRLLVYAKAP
jgi:dolichol-phosphate mannosyltransferase